MSLSTLSLETPRAFLPLLKPARYKGAYGGRGGAKSHFFAEEVLLRAIEEPIRIICIREVQNSIRDSVRQLLVDKIQALELGAHFEVLDAEIRVHNGGLINFKGMQSYNAANIKSLEGYKIAWVEEAQTLSQHSLDLLRPTLREEGSELWFSWNPRFNTDPVDAFFRKTPPPDAVSVCVNWSDNPWFPVVLCREMQHDFETDPDKAEHIWNGAYYTGEGTILAKWVAKAEREGRIHNGVHYDPMGAPLEVTSDIGFRDTATWWYWQRRLGGFALVDYDQDIGLDADDWIPRIQERISLLGAQLGKIWLPQDAKAKTFQSKHSAVERFLLAFGAQKISIVPAVKVADRINAARFVMPRCEFNKTRCEEGLNGLRAWSFEYNEETQILSREPRHDWASHPGDGFSYGAVVMQEIIEKEEPKPEPLRGITVGGNQVTLNELWQTNPRRREARY